MFSEFNFFIHPSHNRPTGPLSQGTTATHLNLLTGLEKIISKHVKFCLCTFSFTIDIGL